MKNDRLKSDSDGCLFVMIFIILIIVWGMSDAVDSLVSKFDKLDKKIESIK